MLRDKIVFTVTGKLQELILREDNLTLDKAVKICGVIEQSNRRGKEFRESGTLPSSSTSVNEITQNSETKTPDGKKGSQMNKTSHKGKGKLKFNCKFCGHKHEKQRDKCPAWARHLTTAKVSTTSSLSAKIFMHLTNPMIMRKILMINGSCL